MNCKAASAHLLVRFVLAILLLATMSCSIKQRAVDALATVLDDAEVVYLSDEDPELVGAAFPFNLKTIETLLQSSPNHRGLLLTATRAFLFYTYGFVETEAQRLQDTDFFASERVRHRAARLYLRAYRYGLRGLEVDHPGLSQKIPVEPSQAVLNLRKKDVPLAVWTAAALGLAIGVSTDNPETTADIAVVGALLNRALELDETYAEGTIHEFLIGYESQRVGGSVDEARRHFQRALDLSGSERCGIWLTWAENISISEQNRAEFERLIDQVLACDPDNDPDTRLLTILAQRRAEWLKNRIEDLFLDTGEPR